MPIETISSTSGFGDLNETYPLAGDDVSQGDDHIRLIKQVLKNSLGNGSMEFKVLTTPAVDRDWMVIVAQQPTADVRVGASAGTISKTAGGYAVVMVSDGGSLAVGVMVSTYAFSDVDPATILNSANTTNFRRLTVEFDGEIRADDWYVDL